MSEVCLCSGHVDSVMQLPGLLWHLSENFNFGYSKEVQVDLARPLPLPIDRPPHRHAQKGTR